MSENKKFVLVLILIMTAFTGEKIYRRWRRPERKDRGKNYVVKMDRHTYRESHEPLDINTATLDEMVSRKIGISYGRKIIEYREITGGFSHLEELTRISGIGRKTYEKLKGKLVVETPPKIKRVNINEADDQELLYLGFTKKEVGLIRDYLRREGRIFDNVALMDLLGRERYEELGKNIEY